MMRQVLLCGLTLLCFLSVTFAQVVNPGGGVYSISDIPGLRPELDLTITNAIKGADTGAPTGNVTKVGRQVEVNFPTIPSMLYITTNSIHGTVYIDPSGITPISFLMSFPNAPFITLTPYGTNITQLLTPVLLTSDTNGATFAVVSSGAIVTNAYRVDWQANDGAGLSWSGQSLAAFGGATNLYLNNGSNAMKVFYFPVGSGAGKWLACDLFGYGSWQDRTIANLTDGADVFKKDGTVLPTADFNMNGKNIYNATKIQLADGAAAGRYLSSDANGWGTWTPVSFNGWSTYAAVSILNMNGYAITAAGALGVNGTSTFNGNTTHNGAVLFNGLADFTYATAFYSTLAAGDRSVFSKAGGSYGSPDFWTKGYARHDGVADFRGGLNANSLVTANNGILAYPSTLPGVGNTAIMAAPSGAHILSEGNIVAGDDVYLIATVPAFGPPYGNIIAQRNVYAAGAKPFRIQHPRNPNKLLFHAAIESPRVELLYRGKVTLANGKATINLNTYYGLIPQTLDAMLTNLTVNVYDNAGWTQVRCKTVTGVSFEIEAKDATCNDTVEWVAIGTRCDDGVKDYRMEANK